LSGVTLRITRPCGPTGAVKSCPVYLRDNSSMCRRASSPHLGPVLGILAVDQHGDARVAGDVPGPLPLRFGIDQDVLVVGVDPGEQRLRMAVRHQGHHRGQVLALGEPGHVIVERHHGSPYAPGGIRGSAAADVRPANHRAPPQVPSRPRSSPARGPAPTPGPACPRSCPALGPAFPRFCPPQVPPRTGPLFPGFPGRFRRVAHDRIHVRPIVVRWR
jgi:hypothetical protein